MTLNAAQQQQTRVELRANLDRSGWTRRRAAQALGLSVDRVDAALTVAGARPADVWAVRDLLEEAALAAGAEPQPYTHLPENARAAAEGWFRLRPRIAASRGLGHALAREYLNRGSHVVATARGPGRTALHDLQEPADRRLEIEHVDITAPEQVEGLRERLSPCAFDLLFVHAGVTNNEQETTADVATEEFVRLMLTNALSPLRVVDTLAALVVGNGTIGVMSSGQGSVANNTRGGFRSAGPARRRSTS